MRRSSLMSAVLPLAIAMLTEIECQPPGDPRRRRRDYDLEPEPTGPSKGGLEYQATADAIRAERLKRKAENFAKRQPKAKPS